VPADTSPVRLHGEACIACGATEQPLRPAGQVVTAGRDGVSHVWDVVRCWRDRHEVVELEPDEKGRVMHGIRDWHNDGRLVENDGEVERYPMPDSAQAWVRGRRYLDESLNRTGRLPEAQAPPVGG
jgi:hypothetical protein